MLCSQCKHNEANYHYKALVNHKVTQVDLCEQCAVKAGFPFPSMESGLGGLLGSSLSFPSMSPTLSELADLLSRMSQTTKMARPSACPSCRWTLVQVQKTGKLGCPTCYTHFSKDVEAILRKIQGQTQHVGKRPGDKTPVRAKPLRKKLPEKETVASLKARLEKAVKEEKYEEAALLRDQINGRVNKPKKNK